MSFPELFANRLHPKIAAFGYSVAAGFGITVSVIMDVNPPTGVCL